jgi:L-aminopeptidase/D-esterase-like protein
MTSPPAPQHRRAAGFGSITDVPGVLVGHHQRRGRGWRTGTTAVIVLGGAAAGVAVRGGGPGTRETDALCPDNLVDRIHGICLSGGSAYGLAAADGVMAWLADRRLGFPVGDDPSWVVPVVPAAVIFDLGRGGTFGNRPDAAFGQRAAAAARATRPATGAVGAGTGAVAGGLQGGVGTASTIVGDPASGLIVGALAVVNAAGRVIDPGTGLPWDAAAAGMRRPSAAERAAVLAATEPSAPPSAVPPLNTTIGVVATSAALTRAECTRLATVAHDGLARAVRPSHSLFDGDTIFAVATGDVELPSTAPRFRDPASRPARVSAVLDAAASCFALACLDAVVSARSHGGGAPPAFRELCPSACCEPWRGRTAAR